MIALEQARQHMESLGLKQAAEALDNTLDAAAGKQLRVSGRKGFGRRQRAAYPPDTRRRSYENGTGGALMIRVRGSIGAL